MRRAVALRRGGVPCSVEKRRAELLQAGGARRGKVGSLILSPPATRPATCSLSDWTAHQEGVHSGATPLWINPAYLMGLSRRLTSPLRSSAVAASTGPGDSTYRRGPPPQGCCCTKLHCTADQTKGGGKPLHPACRVGVEGLGTTLGCAQGPCYAK